MATESISDHILILDHGQVVVSASMKEGIENKTISSLPCKENLAMQLESVIKLRVSKTEIIVAGKFTGKKGKSTCTYYT